MNFSYFWWIFFTNFGMTLLVNFFVTNFDNFFFWKFRNSSKLSPFSVSEFSPKLVTKKIRRNYCHQNWWHFRHLRTHQFLQFTKIFTKIGEKMGENSVENSIHQNVHQNWWKFWRKCTRKWVPYPTSFGVNKNHRLVDVAHHGVTRDAWHR